MLNRKNSIIQKKGIAGILLLLMPAFAGATPQGEWGGTVNMGLTFGGDKLATAEYTDGDSEDIDAGELLFFSGGMTHTLNEIQLQVTVGYYFDQANGDNGKINFTRYPFDFLAFWKQEKFRVGGGITYHLNPQFKVDVDGGANNGKIKFDDAIGFALQADYIFTGNATLGIRITSIEYEASNTFGSDDVDGDNIGIVLGYLF